MVTSDRGVCCDWWQSSTVGMVTCMLMEPGSKHSGHLTNVFLVIVTTSIFYTVYTTCTPHCFSFLDLIVFVADQQGPYGVERFVVIKRLWDLNTLCNSSDRPEIMGMHTEYLLALGPSDCRSSFLTFLLGIWKDHFLYTLTVSIFLTYFSTFSHL